MLHAAWDMSESFEDDQSEKARQRLAKKSEARQRALRARRGSRDLESNNQENKPAVVNRRQSWGGRSSKKSPFQSKPGSAGKSGVFEAPAQSRANRRKSWTKSSVVLNIEQMQKRRLQRRLSSQIEMQQKREEMEEYGEWGMFAKHLKDTRKEIAAASKVCISFRPVLMLLVQ